MAFLALRVALGGNSYAVVELPSNSLDGAQIKRNAVTSSEVKNGSLLRWDFRAGQHPLGATTGDAFADPLYPTAVPGDGTFVRPYARSFDPGSYVFISSLRAFAVDGATFARCDLAAGNVGVERTSSILRPAT